MSSWRSRCAGSIGALLLLLTGCSEAVDAPTTNPNSDDTSVPSEATSVATTEAAPPSEPTVTTPPITSVPTSQPDSTRADETAVGDLAGWETIVVKVGEEELNVALADDARERSQGLRGVGDIGDLDGMIFVFENPREATFIMEDTIMPIDIGFYDPGGELVRTYEMVPCREDDAACDVYPSGAAVAHALEVPSGTFSFSEDARLTIP